MNIIEVLPDFKKYLEGYRGYSPLTIKLYGRILELFNDFLVLKGGPGGKSREIGSIGPVDVEEWLKDLFYFHGNTQGVSRATKLSAIKTFWKYLFYKGLIEANLINNIPAPRVSRPMPKKFTTKQLRLLLSAQDLSTPRGIRDHAIIKVLYGSGPRVAEIRKLNVGDLHSGGKDLYAHYYTKGSKERTVRLTRVPAEALMNWLAIREDFVAADNPDAAKATFVSMAPPKAGCRLSVSAYNGVVKKYAALVGIRNERVFVHRMRTTFATDLYDAGCGILEISIQMGHTSVETTQRYIAVSNKALSKTAISDKRWRDLEKTEEGT